MRKSVGGKGFAFSAALLYNRTNTLGWSGEFRTGMEAVTDEDSDCHERRRGLKCRGRAFVQGRQRVHRRDDEALSQRRRRHTARAHMLLARRCRGRQKRLPTSSASPTMSSISPTISGEKVIDKFVRSYEAGTHAEPLHRLQPLYEVRQTLSTGGNSRLRPHRDRALCAHHV